MPELGDHYRPVDAAHQNGVYRVVGTTDGVALLRVTDADGRRRATGELVHADDLSGFDAAPDPDAGVHPVRELRNLLQGLYWSVRRFL